MNPWVEAANDNQENVQQQVKRRLFSHLTLLQVTTLQNDEVQAVTQQNEVSIEMQQQAGERLGQTAGAEKNSVAEERGNVELEQSTAQNAGRQAEEAVTSQGSRSNALVSDESTRTRSEGRGWAARDQNIVNSGAAAVAGAVAQGGQKIDGDVAQTGQADRNVLREGTQQSEA